MKCRFLQIVLLMQVILWVCAYVNNVQYITNFCHNMVLLIYLIVQPSVFIANVRVALCPVRRAEMEITNRIKQLGGKESPTAALRELECVYLHPDST